MRIALITDIHVGEADENTYEVDVRKNFETILKEVQQRNFDELIVLGDLCFMEGKTEIYKWIKTQLDVIGLPYHIIAGNHDDTPLMAEAFGLEDEVAKGRLYFTRNLGNRTGIFLDTGPKSVDATQLKWLKHKLSNLKGEILVFMHHPPIMSGVPYMDNNHSLTNMEEVQQIFLADKRIIPIFSGHYHVDKTIQLGNMLLQITPSCFFQIDQKTADFRLDHYRIGLRTLEVTEQSFKTTLEYFDGHKLIS